MVVVVVVGWFQMTSINFMERCMVKLYKERADRLLKRRQEDVKDQSLEYMPSNYADFIRQCLMSFDMCPVLLYTSFFMHNTESVQYIPSTHFVFTHRCTVSHQVDVLSLSK